MGRHQIAVANRCHRHNRPVHRVNILLVCVLAMLYSIAPIFKNCDAEGIRGRHPTLGVLNASTSDVQPHASHHMCHTKHHTHKNNAAQDKLHLHH
eukprot:COSAG06_NODE_3789_length_4901_cov_4.959600_4_plen_95_part_00